MRPRLPVALQRQVMADAGHRCAVCGAPTPLELASIVPWRAAKEHKAEDLICLCASCHSRADRENWGKETLLQYKNKPWVMRQVASPEPPQKREDGPSTETVELRISLSSTQFDERHQKLLKYALASFLDISPEEITIVSVEKG